MTVLAAGSTAIEAAPAARFSQALDRLNPAGGRIGLAVSGGPDSMAMLLLAHEVIPNKFEVASVDHGLRPEARDECALVERACHARGISCVVLKVEIAEGNLQQRAREARYAALANWAKQRRLAAISTAHHADDQAETLLMRLNRASGLAGLAGIRPLSWVGELAVIRPLLGFRRTELARLVAQGGIAVVLDPSNEDESFDRVRIRKALAGADWLDPLAMARSALNLAEADGALDSYARLLWSERVSQEGDVCRYSPPAPRAVTLRIVAEIIRMFGGSPRGSDVARLLDRLEHGEGGNVAGVLATQEGGDWVFRPEPPRRAG